MCQSEPLTSHRGVTVDRCSCGAIHLRVGPVTLHVDGERLQALTEALSLASSALAAEARLAEAEREGRASPRLRLVGEVETIEA